MFGPELCSLGLLRCRCVDAHHGQDEEREKSGAKQKDCLIVSGLSSQFKARQSPHDLGYARVKTHQETISPEMEKG